MWSQQLECNCRLDCSGKRNLGNVTWGRDKWLKRWTVSLITLSSPQEQDFNNPLCSQLVLVWGLGAVAGEPWWGNSWGSSPNESLASEVGHLIPWHSLTPCSSLSLRATALAREVSQSRAVAPLLPEPSQCISQRRSPLLDTHWKTLSVY